MEVVLQWSSGHSATVCSGFCLGMGLKLWLFHYYISGSRFILNAIHWENFWCITLIPTQKWIVQGWEHRASWFCEGLGGVFCDYDAPQWLVSTLVAHLSGSFLAQWPTCWRALKILRSRGSEGSRSLWCHLSFMFHGKTVTPPKKRNQRMHTA